MPKVSVVIPSYNCAPFLAEALDSVLTQTYSDIEVIVVDDGSTDHTPEVVIPYLNHVRYIRQPNRGLSAARNAGIVASSGIFIALLDADDAWIPTKLAEEMPHFSDPEVGIVCSDFSVKYFDGKFLPSYLSQRPLASSGYVLDNYIQSRFLFPSTMIIRRKCFDECGLFDEEMLACEDLELFMKTCKKWKVELVRKQLMIRREGVHNLTANHEKIRRYTILAFQKFLAATPRMNDTTCALVHRELGSHCFDAGYAAFNAGEMKNARQRLKESMVYDASTVGKCIPLLLASWIPAGFRLWLQKVWRSK